MIIKPRIRGFICTTAHPVGCAALVDEQIRWTKAQAPITDGPRNVLVIGGSGGYGLASRIVAGFGAGARTLCLSFEKEPAADRTATAGWYNCVAFDRVAGAHGLYARSVNADAFADATKAQIADIVRRDLGGVDLLVYSLAAPVRTDPDTGVLYRSAIKPIGRTVHIKTLNVEKGVVHEADLAPASVDGDRVDREGDGGRGLGALGGSPARSATAESRVQDHRLHLHRQPADMADLLGRHARKGQGGSRPRCSSAAQHCSNPCAGTLESRCSKPW